MTTYKKQRQNIIIFSALVLLTLITATALTFILDLHITFKGVAIILTLLSFTLGVLFVQPKYNEITNKFNRERIRENKEVSFMLTSKFSLASFKVVCEEKGFALFCEKENLAVYYKLEKQGNIAMQKPTKASLLFYLIDEKIDFFHPEIGIVIASFNEENLKVEKSKNFSILIFRKVEEISNPLIDEADRVMFFTRKQDTITQINILHTDETAYLLENESFYPTIEYQELAILAKIFLKGESMRP